MMTYVVSVHHGILSPVSHWIDAVAFCMAAINAATVEVSPASHILTNMRQASTRLLEHVLMDQLQYGRVEPSESDRQARDKRPVDPDVGSPAPLPRRCRKRRRTRMGGIS
jgi:hypothetical protein